MPLTKIDISSTNKVDIKNHIFVFQCFNLIEAEIKFIMFFFFYNQIYFPFSFSCACLMGKFKKTEYNPIYKAFT